jgi:hypothetical protein
LTLAVGTAFKQGNASGVLSRESMGNDWAYRGGQRIQDSVICPRSTNFLVSHGGAYRMCRRRAWEGAS